MNNEFPSLTTDELHVFLKEQSKCLILSLKLPIFLLVVC